MLYFVTMLIGCWLVLGIRCCDQIWGPLQDLRELPRFVTQSVRNGVFSTGGVGAGTGEDGGKGKGKDKGKGGGRPTKLAAT